MLGKQIKVYLTFADRLPVVNYLTDELDSVLIEDESPARQPLLTSIQSDNPLGVFICPRRFLNRLNPHYIDARSQWFFRILDDPLVEWGFSLTTSVGMHPGRFYFAKNPSNIAGDPDSHRMFAEFTAKLLRWIRKNTQLVDVGWGRERLGADAAAKFSRGEIVLRRGPAGTRY